jgi:hypothetical protein
MRRTGVARSSRYQIVSEGLKQAGEIEKWRIFPIRKNCITKNCITEIEGLALIRILFGYPRVWLHILGPVGLLLL